jgi:hypothetical protein
MDENFFILLEPLIDGGPREAHGFTQPLDGRRDK